MDGGEPALAEREVSNGLAAIEQDADAWAEPELLRLRGEVFAASGRASSDVEGAFEEALSSARAYPDRLYELRAATSLARHWQGEGRVAQAIELLEGVCGVIEEPGDVKDYREAETAC